MAISDRELIESLRATYAWDPDGLLSNACARLKQMAFGDMAAARIKDRRRKWAERTVAKLFN